MQKSKDMMLNAAAVGLAGAAQDEALAITQFVRDMGGNGQCTLIGMGLRSSPVYACLANGLMVRLLEFDDEIVSRESHPTAAIFPVVMALAELERCSGKQTLTAFALGCEITSKLGALITPHRSGDPRAVHPDQVAGVSGAAAAAGVMLGLSQPEMETALEIGACRTSSNWSHPNGPTTPLIYGQTAMAGVMAALLAQMGMTGPGHGSLPGLPPSSISPGQQEEFFTSLGNPYDVIRPGLALRLYPCSLAAHSAIDAVLQLLQQHRVEPGHVESVTVSVPPATQQALSFEDPQTAWEARHSLKYLVAVALFQGQPLIEQFSQTAVADPAVRRLMRRITITAGETPTDVSRQPAAITVTTTDGRKVQQRSDFARGGPELPLDPEELDAKFLYCARHSMTPDHVRGAIEQFRDLENIQDVSGLASILGA